MRSGGTWVRLRRWPARLYGDCSWIDPGPRPSAPMTSRSSCVVRVSAWRMLSVSHSDGTGVDSATQRDALLEIGFRYGIGDLYPAAASQNTTWSLFRPEALSRSPAQFSLLTRHSVGTFAQTRSSTSRSGEVRRSKPSPRRSRRTARGSLRQIEDLLDPGHLERRSRGQGGTAGRTAIRSACLATCSLVRRS